ncbi:MAG TPA: succinate dehydrogenase assembly factor 2 [Steroidobacteraceae bacterium]|nr:succinate dehydrogenase assembly factor 2 [Steroidobacteraceae bacterium]
MGDAIRNRLRWRCRRGMKELDVLLARWIEEGWPDAAEERRLAFAWLLEQPDPDIADWLIYGARPADAGRAALIDDILRRRA